jgi:hypothetical protein
MGDWDRFGTFKGLYASCDIVDRMKNVGAVVPTSTFIAYPDGHTFQDDKPILVLEGFAFHHLGPNGSFAILTSIVVHNL